MQHGFEQIARNFSGPDGEIALVIHDAEHRAFIDVRYRVSNRFGSAIKNVTTTNQRKLKRCSALSVNRQKAWPKQRCRFDVIAYDAPIGGVEPEWIRAAFD